MTKQGKTKKGKKVEKEETVGKQNMADLRKVLEQNHKGQKTYNLSEDDSPTAVTEWIPTGSRWLDSIINRSGMGGIPSKKISEIGGLEGVGKSYMAAQICINAQKMGYNVVYFDSEMSLSPTFQEKMGCDLDKFLYIPATTVEMVFETIETILNSGKRNFIVWDSLAQTPTNQSQDAGYDPSSSIAYKARVISNAMQKLTQPIAIQESALLVVNQLKTNIASGPSARFEMMMEPYVTPGGKTQAYSYSLRIWLTKRKAKSAAVVDESGEKYGCEVKCSIKKSRFGSEGRTCHFDIVWGEDYVGVLDEKSWLDAISKSDFIKIGSWCQLLDKDKKVMKQFRKSEFEELCKTDEAFRERVLELMDEEVIFKKTLITEEDLVDDEEGEEDE